MIHKDVLVIGAGPSGLSAAIEAGKAGADTLLVDLNLKAGGQLFKQIHKFFGSSAHHSGTRGYEIGSLLLKQARDAGVEIWLQSTVIGIFPGGKVGIERGLDNGEKDLVTLKAKTIIIATGASENAIRFKGWTTPGVMGAGAAQTMVNVNHVRPGENIVMIGSGNVGLIVSYQLMQAGCNVVALLEAAPKVGGYSVHAAKIRRAGVPIYTSRTIIEALAGEDGSVCGCVTAAVDDHFQPVPGTEETLKCDVITLATGMKPTMDLVKLAGCALKFHGPLGGYVPIHDERLETSVKGVFVAGDSTGVEEANTALDEGKIAGISAAEELGYISHEDADAMRSEIWSRLDSLRLGPFGERRMKEKKAMMEEYSETVKVPAAFQ
ncbi:MAG: FAD-binding protein [Lachnospiraceae bacterium]|uniref:FAD-binding protein n=1 Tax=Candidatus Weimeria bifida TaxID=2599074 RepID=A0A6N7IXE6_9FIRM|nr:FAD-binding protein [Candidatus Weimeria bifida]RRF94873.1 MAG: FAD-binding protein [Lachnospiraceae bacterium]